MQELLPEQRALVFGDALTERDGELRVWSTPWHEERVLPALETLQAEGRVVRGEFRPDGVEREWCNDDVLRHGVQAFKQRLIQN